MHGEKPLAREPTRPQTIRDEANLPGAFVPLNDLQTTISVTNFLLAPAGADR